MCPPSKCHRGSTGPLTVIEDDAGAGQEPWDGLFSTSWLRGATLPAWEVADGANLCPVRPDRARTEPRDQLVKKIQIKSDLQTLSLPSPEG